MPIGAARRDLRCDADPRWSDVLGPPGHPHRGRDAAFATAYRDAGVAAAYRGARLPARSSSPPPSTPCRTSAGLTEHRVPTTLRGALADAKPSR